MAVRTKLTGKEQAVLAEAEAAVNSLDMDKMVKLFAAYMHNRPVPEMIASVCAFFETVEECAVEAAAIAGTKATKGELITIDQAVDASRKLMAFSMNMRCISHLLQHACMANGDAVHGLFTTDEKELGSKLEGLRTALIEMKNEHDLKQKRKR